MRVESIHMSELDGNPIFMVCLYYPPHERAVALKIAKHMRDKYVRELRVVIEAIPDGTKESVGDFLYPQPEIEGEEPLSVGEEAAEENPVKCRDCLGVGRTLTKNPIEGYRSEKCALCEGTGKVLPSLGDGWEKCALCNGKGRRAPGEGWLADFEWEDCRDCKGSGKTPIPNTEPPPEDRKMRLCLPCGGKGMAELQGDADSDGVTCRHCKGTGILT